MSEMIYTELEEAENLPDIEPVLIQNNILVKYFMLALFVIGAGYFAWDQYNKKPPVVNKDLMHMYWRVVINNSRDGATVQFINSKTNLMTPKFKVQSRFRNNYDVIITQRRFKMQGLEVEIYDMEKEAGYLKINLQYETFTLTSECVLFNDKKFEYIPQLENAVTAVN